MTQAAATAALERGLSRRLAQHVAQTSFEQLDSATVTATKTSILDTTGVMIAASSLGEGLHSMCGTQPEIAFRYPRIVGKLRRRAFEGNLAVFHHIAIVGNRKCRTRILLDQ